MTSLTLQIAESDGDVFLLHSQALKNPVGSPAVALSQHDTHPQAAAGAECAESRFSTSSSLGGCDIPCFPWQHTSPAGCSLAKPQRDPSGLRCPNPF